MILVTDAISRLAGQFSASPKLQALLSAIVGPLDDVLATTDSLKTERWIDTAIGTQLDGCGAIVGEARAGRDDDAYRAAIRFRVFVNVSQGTPEALIQGLQYLIDSDDKQYLEMYPATAILFADGPNVPVNIHAQIQDLAPAALSDVPVLVSYAELPFRFSNTLNNQKLKIQTGNFITANGLRIKVSSTNNLQTGTSFGGVAVPIFAANGSRLKIGRSKLRINSPNHNIVFGSDYNLTGVYQ